MPDKLFPVVLILFIKILFSGFSLSAQSDVMLQGFYWDVPVNSENKDGFWYDSLSSKMELIREAGFNEIWLPPPSKGNWGINDMGYGIYDHYDLGQYHQIGSRETRFGSYEELQRLIKLAHDTTKGQRINLLADIVLNHMYSTQIKDYEINPTLREYIINEAVVEGQAYHPYPVNEIIWQISPANSSQIDIILKCFESQQLNEWNGGFAFELDTSLQALLSAQRANAAEFSRKDTLMVPGYYSGQFENKNEPVHVSVNLPGSNKLYIRLSARQKNGNEYVWTDQARGIYISEVNTPDGSLYDELKVLTSTGITYVAKDDLPDLRWNYSFYHPGFIGDYLRANPTEDSVTPALKWFGHDLNHANPELIGRMAEWGRWLRDSVGYDGYRFDFVMGVDQEFIAEWIKRVGEEKEQRATMVAEYFTKNKQRIREWASFVGDQNPELQIKLFDFPLKFELNEMCHSNSGEYDMRNLLYAGMLFDSIYSLPADRLVSFVDNHDTGKESDKWLTRNWEMAYAYIFFNPAQPCVFYNHFFGDHLTDYTSSDKQIDIPGNLQATITGMMRIRKEYLAGEMVHVSDTSEKYRNFYVAFRGGGDKCSGAFLTLSNESEQKDTPVLKLNNKFQSFYGKELINLLQPSQSVKVSRNGEVSFILNGCREGIWLIRDEL